mmetsp:Transcript_11915/g.29215  ORF Transcript_11915/g.29215 Transcript_11915/m.29215 type:complete len:205 (-) Transcript_11915:394-1008(-)
MQVAGSAGVKASNTRSGVVGSGSYCCWDTRSGGSAHTDTRPDASLTASRSPRSEKARQVTGADTMGPAGTMGLANSALLATPEEGGTLMSATRSSSATASRLSSCGCHARRRVAEEGALNENLWCASRSSWMGSEGWEADAPPSSLASSVMRRTNTSPPLSQLARMLEEAEKKRMSTTMHEWPLSNVRAVVSLLSTRMCPCLSP